MAEFTFSFSNYRMIPRKLSMWRIFIAFFCMILFSSKADGSPPAYHLSVGFGSGSNNWLVHVEGGGWCHNVTNCFERSNTSLGSSIHMEKQIAFAGILSSTKNYNPDFYNWNRVKVRYCDGSSFTGDIETVEPDTKLHYRGARIWRAVMDELLARGMDKAENVLLSGCSSGGLTSILHCDKFRAILPNSSNVKCLSDAGFFVNEKDILGKEYIADLYNDVITTHGSANNLPLSCTSRLTPNMCFFPQYVAQEIETPFFFLNSPYDAWQIGNILVPDSVDPNGTWVDCKAHIAQCSDSQLEIIQGFRNKFVEAVDQMGSSRSRGLFLNSCFCHCQSQTQETWLASRSPELRNTPIAKAVGDWYFDRSRFEEIDCPYPCDSSCINHMDISSQ